jgi:integrase/recombinase XerD
LQSDGIWKYGEGVLGRMLGPVILAEYDAWMRERQGWTPQTRRTRLSTIQHAEDWLYAETGKHLVRATEADVVAYLATCRSTRTRNRKLGDLKSFFRWAIADGHRKTDPTANLDRLREPRNLPRPLTREEAERLLAAAKTVSQRAATIITLLLYTGIRREEAVTLEWADVDLEGGTIRVLGKGRKERVIPLAEAARRALEEWRPENATGYVFTTPWSARGHLDVVTLWRDVAQAAEAAGLSRVSPHRLRHTFATEVLRRGADVRHVQALLGHASLATTQVYTQVVTDDLVPAVARLSFDGPRHEPVETHRAR